jgi:hypothetical protein
MWRVITALTEKRLKAIKISEQYSNAGRANELPGWRPEPFDHIYMYNTPHIPNVSLHDPAIRIVTNFRDPRDMACNQYHWALQHPILNKTEQEIAEYRARVRATSIDQFVLNADNNVHFKGFHAVSDRLKNDTQNVLILSYNQLCLDFDNLVARLIAFFGVAPEDVPWERIERERTTNLKNNPAWIGQIWTGTDVMPGRHRNELTRDTIRQLDDKYRDNLDFIRAIELPRFRIYFATEREREEMGRVLAGRGDELFLINDANDVIGQITGHRPLAAKALYDIAMAHRGRQVFGQSAAEFRYEHMIIPNKEVVFRDSLPEQVTFEGEGPRPITQYLNAPAARIWQPYYEPAALQAADATEKFFPDTDSHWNHAGAFRYFGHFLRAKLPDLADVMDAIPLRRFPGRQQGDLGLKLEMPAEPIEILAPQRATAKMVFENGINNEGCIRWFRNEKAESEHRAVVMHDSFTMWLLGIVPEMFREVMFFHGTIFDYEFIERFAPSVVLCLQVERFFVRAPQTGGAMFPFIAREEEEKQAKRRFGEYWRGIYP